MPGTRVLRARRARAEHTRFHCVLKGWSACAASLVSDDSCAFLPKDAGFARFGRRKRQIRCPLVNLRNCRSFWLAGLIFDDSCALSSEDGGFARSAVKVGCVPNPRVLSTRVLGTQLRARAGAACRGCVLASVPWQTCVPELRAEAAFRNATFACCVPACLRSQGGGGRGSQGLFCDSPGLLA